MTHQEARAELRVAKERVVELCLRQGHPAVVVPSPPGAGKTDLVETLAGAAVIETGCRVLIVAPRASQTLDIVERMARSYGNSVTAQLFQPEDRAFPAAIANVPSVRPPVSRSNQLPTGASATVTTIDKAKVSNFAPREFDLMIVDEAYQVAYATFASVAHVARQVVLVGDPGQLPSVQKSDTTVFEGTRHKVHRPAPTELCRLHPDIPVVRLPATMRLTAETVHVVQPSFYPELPFVSAADPAERRVTLAAAGMRSPVDRALDIVADRGGIVALVLPAGRPMAGHVDEEVLATQVTVVDRVLARGASWNGRRLTTGDIGCIDPHVVAVERLAGTLPGAATGSAPMVDTPEIWQGLQRPLMVVTHPLAGRAVLDGFALQPGRWCVMLSRHLLGCIVIARENVGNLLAQHDHDATRPLGTDNVEWSGWRAHSTIWDGLARDGRLLATTTAATG